MNPVLKIVLRIIHYFSIVGTVLFALFAFYEKMVGIEKAEALLEKLNISISYNQILVIGFIFVSVAVITYMLDP